MGKSDSKNIRKVELVNLCEGVVTASESKKLEYAILYKVIRGGDKPRLEIRYLDPKTMITKSVCQLNLEHTPRKRKVIKFLDKEDKVKLSFTPEENTPERWLTAFEKARDECK